VTTEPIKVTPLGKASPEQAGVLTAAQLGLRSDFWSETDAIAALSFITDTPYGGPPSAKRLLRGLLMARFETGADYGDAVLLARVDRLLAIGALDEADALLDSAALTTPQLLGRFFDVNLLTGRPQRACDTLAGLPALAPNRAAEVFCLAINENWQAADVALNLGSTLGEIDETKAALLAFYLDPGLIEAADPPAPSQMPTAFEAYLRDSIGVQDSDAPAPLAFLHRDLAKFIPVRFKMEAAEKLVREGALSQKILFAAYREEVPAASGGVWERADAVQEFDRASAPQDIARTLTRLDDEITALGLRTALAREIAPQLARKLQPSDLPGETWPLVARLLVLGGQTETALAWKNDAASQALLTAFDIIETAKVVTLIRPLRLWPS